MVGAAIATTTTTTAAAAAAAAGGAGAIDNTIFGTRLVRVDCVSGRVDQLSNTTITVSDPWHGLL